jgi:hypothetical protein
MEQSQDDKGRKKQEQSEYCNPTDECKPAFVTSKDTNR